MADPYRPRSASSAGTGTHPRQLPDQPAPFQHGGLWLTDHDLPDKRERELPAALLSALQEIPGDGRVHSNAAGRQCSVHWAYFVTVRVVSPQSVEDIAEADPR